jgi:hypothetical protein
MQSQSEVKDSFKLLILASAVTLVLWLIPFAEVITYPLRLFVTLVHESGHALAALGTLGRVNRVALDWSGSGVTETVGGAGLLISSAGYLSTTLYGAGLLLLLRRLRYLRAVTIGTGVVLIFMTVFFGGNLLAWLAGLVFGIGCIVLALKVRVRVVHFLMSFLAVQCLLNAFYDLRTLVYLSAYDSARPTDAQNMASATGGVIPAMVWAALWSLISLAILAVTMALYYKSLRRRAAIGEGFSLPPMLLDTKSRSAADRIV